MSCLGPVAQMIFWMLAQTLRAIHCHEPTHKNIRHKSNRQAQHILGGQEDGSSEGDTEGARERRARKREEDGKERAGVSHWYKKALPVFLR